jgi:hypothetical protein
MESVPDLESESVSAQDLESTLGISWAGEWLPMELWCEVFRHYCISHSEPKDLDAVDVLRSHPMIAEILDRFLPYLGGIVFKRSHFERAIAKSDGGWFCMTSPESDFVRVIVGNRDPDYNAGRSRRYYRVKYNHDPQNYEVFPGLTEPDARWRILSYHSDHIRIHVCRLTPEAMGKINMLLPWGCFVRDMSESNIIKFPEIFFGIWIPKPPSEWIRGKLNYKICEIKECEEYHLDYKDLYIPPWNPL